MTLSFRGRSVRVFPAPFAGAPVAYVIGGFERAEETAAAWATPRATLAFIDCPDWNRDLSPWPAPACFRGGEAFSGEADRFLNELLTEILPGVESALAARPVFANGEATPPAAASVTCARSAEAPRDAKSPAAAPVAYAQNAEAPRDAKSPAAASEIFARSDEDARDAKSPAAASAICARSDEDARDTKVPAAASAICARKGDARTNVKAASRAIVGVSLAGLFGVYALYRTDAFSLCASVSGSLWFDGFSDFMDSNAMLARPEKIYLSLGDREEYTRNPRLRPVGEATRAASARFTSLGIETRIEMNPGNHFAEPVPRMIRALDWLHHEPYEKGFHRRECRRGMAYCSSQNAGLASSSTV